MNKGISKFTLKVAGIAAVLTIIIYAIIKSHLPAGVVGSVVGKSIAFGIFVVIAALTYFIFDKGGNKR